MSLHMLFFNEIEDYKKVLLYYFRANGHFWFVCVFFFFLELFGMSQLLVTGYLPQMWTNVTSNIILRPHVVLRDLFYL